ncbi:Uncharacterised protein g2678 [Pycnogonum litorale]
MNKFCFYSLLLVVTLVDCDQDCLKKLSTGIKKCSPDEGNPNDKSQEESCSSKSKKIDCIHGVLSEKDCGKINLAKQLSKLLEDNEKSVFKECVLSRSATYPDAKCLNELLKTYSGCQHQIRDLKIEANTDDRSMLCSKTKAIYKCLNETMNHITSCEIEDQVAFVNMTKKQLETAMMDETTYCGSTSLHATTIYLFLTFFAVFNIL